MRAGRRLIFLVVFVAVGIAFALPFVSLRTGATGRLTNFSPGSNSSHQNVRPSSTHILAEAKQSDQSENENLPDGRISNETLSAIGLRRVADPENASKQIAQRLQRK